jgi:pilus assembly protein CpaE
VILTPATATDRKQPPKSEPTAQVFVSDRESEDVIRHCLSDVGVHDAEYTAGTIEAATAALAKRPSPRLLIVDVSGLEDAVARIRQLAQVCELDTGVIVVGDRNDVSLYRDLKYAGVVEYFYKPLISSLLRPACAGILTGHIEHQSGGRTGRLILFIGVRGGVGATTIAVNTAWLLAETWQRWVLFLDLDLQGGDAALQLDVTPSHALREAFEHPDRVDKIFLERGAVSVTQRLNLMAAFEPFGDIGSLQEDAILALTGSLLTRYRYTLVDLPVAVAERLTGLLKLPSTIVLVSGGSLASARDVARWRHRIGPNTNERTLLHILNKFGAHDSLTLADFTRAAGQAPDIIVPYSRDVGLASNLGVKSAQKSTALKRTLAPLIRDLTGEPAKEPQSVFSRLFG